MYDNPRRSISIICKILDRRYMFLATMHGLLWVLPLVVHSVDEDLIGDLIELGSKEMGWWTTWSWDLFFNAHRRPLGCYLYILVCAGVLHELIE